MAWASTMVCLSESSSERDAPYMVVGVSFGCGLVVRVVEEMGEAEGLL